MRFSIARTDAFTPPMRRHWATLAVLAVALLLYLFAGLSLGRVDDGDAMARKLLPSRATAAELPKGAPPAPEPLDFREIPPQDALAINAAMPFSREPNPAAKPFLFAAASEVDKARSTDCLTAAVYYEAAVEAAEGQRAVAQVVLNRLRHPAFPKTVCGVVFQGSDRSTGCQFTFTCDGSLARVPSKAGWDRARKIAEQALAGAVYKPVGWATHYHTNWVVPYWSANLAKLANVGTHIFYRWEGGWGRPPAFRGRYAGVEPQVAKMAALSSVPIDPAAIDASVFADAKALPPGVTPDDLKGRIIRRYEPLRAQSAANQRSEMAKAEVSPSLRWALTGEEQGAKSVPLGSKASSTPPATPVKPETGPAKTPK